MFYTVGAVVASIVVGLAAMKGGESGRLRVWRASIVLAGFGLLSGIGGALSDSVALFYGGAMGLSIGILLALGLGAVVYRDRGRYLDGTRDFRR